MFRVSIYAWYGNYYALCTAVRIYTSNLSDVFNNEKALLIALSSSGGEPVAIYMSEWNGTADSIPTGQQIPLIIFDTERIVIQLLHDSPGEDFRVMYKKTLHVTRVCKLENVESCTCRDEHSSCSHGI